MSESAAAALARETHAVDALLAQWKHELGARGAMIGSLPDAPGASWDQSALATCLPGGYAWLRDLGAQHARLSSYGGGVADAASSGGGVDAVPRNRPTAATTALPLLACGLLPASVLAVLQRPVERRARAFPADVRPQSPAELEARMTSFLRDARGASVSGVAALLTAPPAARPALASAPLWSFEAEVAGSRAAAAIAAADLGNVSTAGAASAAAIAANAKRKDGKDDEDDEGGGGGGSPRKPSEAARSLLSLKGRAPPTCFGAPSSAPRGPHFFDLLAAGLLLSAALAAAAWRDAGGGSVGGGSSGSGGGAACSYAAAALLAAMALASARWPVLRFAAPALERRYARWANASREFGDAAFFTAWAVVGLSELLRSDGAGGGRGLLLLAGGGGGGGAPAAAAAAAAAAGLGLEAAAAASAAATAGAAAAGPVAPNPAAALAAWAALAPVLPGALVLGASPALYARWREPLVVGARLSAALLGAAAGWARPGGGASRGGGGAAASSGLDLGAAALAFQLAAAVCLPLRLSVFAPAQALLMAAAALHGGDTARAALAACAACLLPAALLYAAEVHARSLFLAAERWEGGGAAAPPRSPKGGAADAAPVEADAAAGPSFDALLARDGARDPPPPRPPPPARAKRAKAL